MARMIPEREYTDFHGSKAEERVFDIFSEQLPDSYLVFHSEDWFRAPDQQLSDQPRGEIDFMVAHKEKGLLVLEIKGGGIEYDPGRDEWWTINARGKNKLHKSPAVQANAGMYNLLNRLKRNPRLSDGSYFPGVLGWGLFFPDLRSSDADVFPDMELPEERILFRDSFDDLQFEIDALYDFWAKQHSASGPMDEQTWEGLTKYFLRREFKVVETLGNYIDKSEQQLVRMTENQFRLLDFLGEKKDVFVKGCAGSGKTLLSLEKACRLTEQGLKVLWLCYNRDLSKHVQNQQGDCGFEISHFHSFALGYIKKAKIPFEFPQTDDEWAHFWDYEMADLLMEAADCVADKYDVLILDEAQDFKDEWFTALQYVTTDPDDRALYVFYDPNQSIYGEVPDWLPVDREGFYPLNENVRNTAEIGRASSRLGQIQDSIKFGSEGRPVRVEVAGSESELVDDMRRSVDELLNKQEVSPEDVVILTRRSLGNSPLADVNKLGNYRIVKTSSGNRRQVLWSTIKSYKGLESDVILMLIPKWKEEYASEYYTGASRAKHLLWVFTMDEKVKNISEES